MQYRPTLAELAVAVREFLESEVAPALLDPRLKFRTLVAMNALGMIAREAALEEPRVREEFKGLCALLGAEEGSSSSLADLKSRTLELQTELARRIRGGHLPDGVFAHLERTTRANLEVSNPGQLKRYVP
jgi:hypothetical protein